MGYDDAKKLQELSQELTLWYAADRYNYDYGYDEGEEGAFELCKQALIDEGYDEEDIDDDLINDWVWEQIDEEYKKLIKETNALIKKYHADDFDYFECDFGSDYWNESYTFTVNIDFPYEFDSAEQRDSVYEEIGNLGNLIEELLDIGWQCNYDYDGYTNALQELIKFVQEIPIDDWDEPGNDRR